MKIVVTGALGHIGSRFIRSIPKSHPDAEVIMLDDLSAQRYVSLFDLPTGAKYHFFEADVASAKTDLTQYFAGAQVVVHLAAITDAAGSFANKARVEEVNFNGTKNVAEACARLKVPLFYVSTTSVYGTQAEKVDENCSRADLQPQSPYAETKLKEEQFLRELGQNRGLKFLICRFGTIFGTSPGMRFHTAVNKFCWQAVMGIPLTVWRTALHQVRPYLDLTDAVAAIHFVLQNKMFDGEIYNVLTVNCTVEDILNVIREKIPDLKINFVDEKIMNQLSYHVLNEKIKARGFKFNGKLQQSLHATIALLQNAAHGAVK